MAANVNNYVRAGNAAVQAAVKARKALAANKARLDEIGMEAVAQDAKTRVNTAANNASTAKQVMKSRTDQEIANIRIDTDKEISGIKKGARKAGLLAGGAALLGIGAIYKNKKHEPDEMLELYASRRDKLSGQITDQDSKITSAKDYLDSFKEGGSNASKLNPDGTEKPDFDTAPVPQGPQAGGASIASVLGDAGSIFQQAADITGKYESDSSGGYNAYNLGGSDGGRTAHGSGNSADGKQFGSALTSMTIGQIKDLQSSGKLHAAGRFQFIGNSLPEAAQFAGLDDNALFTPENQNRMFMAFGQKYGSGRWVGLDDASDEERSIVNQAFSTWKP